VGASALASGSQTGIQNTAIGSGAFALNTSGNYGVAVGFDALAANTTGAGNSAFGRRALYNNTTGADNQAVGFNAMFSNTTGASNTAIGSNALQANTTASNNTAVGYQAGYANTTGLANTFLGNKAGLANTTSSDSTIVGYESGYSTTGTANTFVGSQAGYFITSGAKNTVLGRYNGNQGGLDIRTSSNFIVISDGDGNPRGIFDNNGSFYLNTTSIGNVNSDSLNFRVGSGGAGAAFINHVNGTSSGIVYAGFGYNGSQIGTITQSGTTGVLYNVTSDYRLKTVIGAVSGAGARIDALEPIEYTWNSDGSQTRGFLAHKFQEVYASSVSGTKDAIDADGKPVYQSMQASSSEVIADLVAEIQSLRQRVAQLESN
jgi:hypothetical protein